MKDTNFADDGKKGTMSLNLALIVLDRLNTTERIDVAQDNLCEAVQVVSAAAKYRISQRPVSEPRYHGYKCPVCGAICMERPANYCYDCGQALDWN